MPVPGSCRRSYGRCAGDRVARILSALTEIMVVGRAQAVWINLDLHCPPLGGLSHSRPLEMRLFRRASNFGE
jgi:hypothetical protein